MNFFIEIEAYIQKKMKNLITILGPTASGKTKLAANLAFKIDGELISADSRQVYRGMDIGTGKDLDDYFIGGQQIPFHLIDIVEPGYEYNVFEYQNDFREAFVKIVSNKKTPILCGGSGLYLDAVLNDYKMKEAPIFDKWRKKFDQYSDKELVEQLKKIRTLHNTTDIISRERTIRALEIELYKQNEKNTETNNINFEAIIFGIQFERSVLRERITNRLQSRLENDMIEEVKGLLEKGIQPQQLTFYGLEYKFVTLFLIGQLSYDEMYSKLNTAIHQFAKRQMTWFRRMEKQGSNITWIDGNESIEKNIAIIIDNLKPLD
jgi:tRNA dimethylallyltransferase